MTAAPTARGSAASDTALTGLVRPLQLGLSVAHPSGSLGSIGPFVRLPTGGVGLMSTSSVLAPRRARKGDYIHQPGGEDAAALTGETRVARLTDLFTPFVESRPMPFDAAVAELLPDVPWAGNVVPGPAPGAGSSITSPRPPTDDLVGSRVAFVGRTSGYSVGAVITVDLTVPVNTGSSDVLFTGCIEIAGEDGPFSRPGDAGSLVFRLADHAAIGLVFAAMQSKSGAPRTLVCPLAPALDAFGIGLI